MSTKSSPHTDWLGVLYEATDTKKIMILSERLQKRFPDTSPAVAGIWAEVLLSAKNATSESYHQGKTDIECLRKFIAALTAAETAVSALSPMTKNALYTSLYLEAGGSEAADSLHTLGIVIRHAAKSVERTEIIIGASQPEYQTNWKAVGVVDAARRCWEDLGDRPAPPKPTREIQS